MDHGGLVLCAASFAMAILVSGCGDAKTSLNPTGEPAIILYHHLGPEDPQPAGLTEGTVFVEHDCPRIRSVAGETFGTVWPPGYLLQRDGIGMTIIAPRDGIVAHPGERRSFGGGAYRDHAFVEELIGRPIPAQCVEDEMWLVTEVVPPPGNG